MSINENGDVIGISCYHRILSV